MGGSGIDLLEIFLDVPVTIDLSLDIVTHNGVNDPALGFERAAFQGLAGNATLLGDDGPNQLFGSSGDDHIEGRGGDDFLRGDGGTDTIDGGDGIDTCLDGETLANCEP